jgi:Alcohol dehydrogenase GroES-like domain
MQRLSSKFSLRVLMSASKAGTIQPDIDSINRQAARPALFNIGEDAPLGIVPEKMHAWTIRRDRHGDPRSACQLEIVDVPTVGPDDVLVLVMAAGINYNGIWAALGHPVSPLDFHDDSFHIAGSDAAGIVWAVGSNVQTWRPGDEVVVHCCQVDGDDEECNGGDPMLSSSQRIWGYETSFGASNSPAFRPHNFCRGPNISVGKPVRAICWCWPLRTGCSSAMHPTLLAPERRFWSGVLQVAWGRWRSSLPPPQVLAQSLSSPTMRRRAM